MPVTTSYGKSVLGKLVRKHKANKKEYQQRTNIKIPVGETKRGWTLHCLPISKEGNTGRRTIRGGVDRVVVLGQCFN